MKRRLLFIDRDGTILVEPARTYQIDRFELVRFLPRVIRNLAFLREHTDFGFVMVSNQDGLGTADYPLPAFEGPHRLMLDTLAAEGITFDAIHIDPTRPEEGAPTRKPGTAMLTEYFDAERYDLAGSYVIGDRLTDLQLARNLGCRGILIQPYADVELPIGERPQLTYEECERLVAEAGLTDVCALIAASWDRIADFLFAGARTAEVRRTTGETDIRVRVDLDGHGRADIATGLGFFDHMLQQIARHGGIDLTVEARGDLHVDEHHTIEDTAIVLGEAIAQALGDKRGIGRYGFCLPMDDCLCQVALDFGGRPWLVWDADFRRERIGEMPTEMFMHFFKSFSDAARINLHIRAEGTNEHHKIEGIFKALARALAMAVRRDIHHFELPSSKGVL